MTSKKNVNIYICIYIYLSYIIFLDMDDSLLLHIIDLECIIQGVISTHTHTHMLHTLYY